MTEAPERRSRLKRFFTDWGQHIILTGAVLTTVSGGCSALGYEFPLVLRKEYIQLSSTVSGISNTLQELLRAQLEQQEMSLISRLQYIEAELIKNPNAVLIQHKLETEQALTHVRAKLRELENK